MIKRFAPNEQIILTSRISEMIQQGDIEGVRLNHKQGAGEIIITPDGALDLIDVIIDEIPLAFSKTNLPIPRRRAEADIFTIPQTSPERATTQRASEIRQEREKFILDFVQTAQAVPFAHVSAQFDGQPPSIQKITMNIDALPIFVSNVVAFYQTGRFDIQEKPE